MFDIPSGEFERFSSYMQVYKQGASIIVEGQQDEKGFFLLRFGRVGVYKNFGKERELITTIDAVNLFGELSLISSAARPATVEVLSDQVVVYGFRPADVQVLLTNPKWGYLLMTRLIMNQKLNNDQIVDLVEKNRELKQELENDQNKLQEIFSVLQNIQKAMLVGTVVNAREWQYLNALNKSMHALLSQRFPGLNERLLTINESKWKELRQEGLLPEILYTYIQEIMRRK
ncbi:MAG: cyclic nucleotide-binding domain-containing protein [Anaerolineae bacterium]|nr:cyclic nucleotide-binding domain-containing protein [Anaerolineae bacterium]